MMKKITTILLTILLATHCLLFTSCNHVASEESNGEINETNVSAYTPRDYLSEWVGKKPVLRVSSIMDSNVISLPSDDAVFTNIISNDVATQRLNRFLESHDIAETTISDVLGKTYEFDVTYYTVSEKKRLARYEATVDDERIASVEYDMTTGKLTSFYIYESYIKPLRDEKMKKGEKFVSDANEALMFAKEVIASHLDISEYEPVLLQHDMSSSRYVFRMRKSVNGISVVTLGVTIDEYVGVRSLFLVDNTTLELYTACAEYATSPEIQHEAIEQLKSRVYKNPDIAEIKNIELYNATIPSNIPLDYISDKDCFYMYPSDYCGLVIYSKDEDKTIVSLHYKFTAVMKDGSELEGRNGVEVYIPIDWAAEFGEK